jgi:hypothetical protein
VAFDVYLSGRTYQYPCIFTQLLHFVRPPTVILVILWLFLPSFRRRKLPGLSTLGRSTRFAAARSSALSPYPLQRLAERFAKRLAA